jgi:hypothetical protein
MPEWIVGESENTIRELTVAEVEAVAGGGTGPVIVAPRPPMTPDQCTC